MHSDASHKACFEEFDAKGVHSLATALVAAIVVVAVVFGERSITCVNAWYGATFVWGERAVALPFSGQGMLITCRSSGKRTSRISLKNGVVNVAFPAGWVAFPPPPPPYGCVSFQPPPRTGGYCFKH